MAVPRGGSTQWPSAGERSTKCLLQYATPVTDPMGGRGEPIWTNFGTWFAKVTTIPDIANEIQSAILYSIEGPYRSDLIERHNSGVGVRLVTPDLTLKVFQVEDPQARRRTLVAHCGKATNT